jgi:asparagine synthase (glutamine-hydrolysing)
MCGICGIITNNLVDEAIDSSVLRMSAAMKHRGPDSPGNFRDAHVAMAMRRLSIIDLEGGNQPLFNEDASVVVMANGEIYNHVELRTKLAANGHRFKTGSDCETIVHLYEDFGADCVQHMRGMFAFALWDARSRRLMLARDRMGEKPLYLYSIAGKLVFASELKALLKSGMVPFELDPDAINLYFHYQYVPEPNTPLKGVRKLDAAHVLIVDVGPWRVTERRYWNMADAPPIEGDPASLIRLELESISEIIIRSDVPVGIALSGGLDSSVVAALAVKKYPGVMHAFSVGYPGGLLNDERKDAKALADHLGMPFHDIELDTARFVEFFPELIYLQDDPIADIAGFGYYSVSKMAREQGVPVMLQGQGGDELFWGYPWVADAATLSKKKAAVCGTDWRSLGAYLGFALPDSLSLPRLKQWIRKGGGLLSGLSQWSIHRKAPQERLFFMDLTPDFTMTSREIRSYYSKQFLNQLDDERPSELFTIPRPWRDIEITITGLICDTYLRENGLAQGDRLSMASSVELRLPLVDYRLVETVVGLRKFRSDLNMPAKSWFKQALQGGLPQWVMNRPKRGFAPPVREWHSALFQKYGKSLVDGFLVQEGVLTPERAKVLSTGDFPAGASTPLSFKALVLETWRRGMSASMS